MTDDIDEEVEESRRLLRQAQDLLDLVKKLEERIIVLERKDSVVRIIPSDNYYWEHG